MKTKIKVGLDERTTAKLSREQAEQLRKVIFKSTFWDNEKMERRIWWLTYNPEEALKKLGIEGVDGEAEIMIRGEMVKAYCNSHPEWTYGRREKVDTVEKQYLQKALGYDTFAYDTVMSHIRMRATFEKEEIQKVLRRLNSSRAESQFGGIRSLGFRKKEANFLKDAAGEMGRVLEEMTKQA